MAEITEKPNGLPSGNDLDKIADPAVVDGQESTAYITLASTNIRISKPPKITDEGTLLIRWRCTGDGHKLQKDGELRPKRTLDVLAAWWPGERPIDDPNQPALFDTEGEPTEDAEDAEDAEDVEEGATV